MSRVSHQIGSRRLHLSPAQTHLLAELLAHPGVIVPLSSLSSRQVTDLRSQLEAHGLGLGRVLTPGYQGYVLTREEAGRLSAHPPHASSPSSLPPAQRGIQRGLLTPLANRAGHRFQRCAALRLLVIDEQAFVLSPLLFTFVSALFLAEPGQPVRRSGPTPLRRQILHLRRLLRTFDLDIVTVQHYGYLLVDLPSSPTSVSRPALAHDERICSMTTFNQCTFLGRVARDPDRTQTSQGRRLARFPLLVEQRAESPLRLNVIAWGTLAETVGQDAHLGAQVLVQGKLQVRPFTDRQTGRTIPLLELVASTVLVVSPPALPAPASDSPRGETADHRASSGLPGESEHSHA